VRSIFKSRLGTIIAMTALTGGALVVLAAPASATTEVTKCVNIDFSGNTSTGAASVTVVRQNISAQCPSAVPVRVWQKVRFAQSGFMYFQVWYHTYYGPSVTSGISRIPSCDTVTTQTIPEPNGGDLVLTTVATLDSFGWQYYKNGAWYNGYAGALT